MTPKPVVRDKNGYWTHPECATFFKIADFSEFKKWLNENMLQSNVCMLQDYDHPANDRYQAGNPNISDWNPPMPAGDSWFIGSIHDTEDGPVCIWLRSKISQYH